MSDATIRAESERLASDEHSAADIETMARLVTQYENTGAFLRLVNAALRAAATNAISEGLPYAAEVALLAQCEAFEGSPIHDEFARLDIACWAAIDAL